ncbi:MAG TPA: ATP-dependent exonuclease SbcCD, C subunit-like protein, partial [Thiolapillus brandeum]|nr:ATP-dependent exonuclease SbcCD, C subunit-like protein [Thiolapillus brandeum]
ELERRAGSLERQMQAQAARITEAREGRQQLNRHLAQLAAIAEYRDFAELDWQPLARGVAALEEERRRLEAASDILQTLNERLQGVEQTLAKLEEQLKGQQGEKATTRLKIEQARALRAECEAALAELPPEEQAARFERLAALQQEALGALRLTVESCDRREREMRDWLTARIDAEDKRLARLQERIIRAMQAYRTSYPLETAETDVSLAAADEYLGMLEQLQADDLPRFEARFKTLLNENTIREVANFQSQLARERQTIRERIEHINRSLAQIDYNPNRYIMLEPQSNPDREIRDFQQALRQCTEGSLTGSDDEHYSEAKFLQVKEIIGRFRGREGLTELDRRWTRKVTDVRSWFLFSAAERWREDDSEYEHYTDSGGKSGGQKEKLAYTVLAASLAYQFGLAWGEVRSRSFRFVVIDEAFGRGSDESARFGLELFQRLNLQLLIVTPLQKIHVIEPYVAGVGFVHTEGGREARLRNLTIEEYRSEREARRA